MKKIFIGLIMAGSMSSHAYESDFERGFNEGKDSCEAVQENWLCESPKYESTYYATTINPEPRILKKGHFNARGRSRAEAVAKINTKVIQELKSLSKSVLCYKL